MKAGQGNTPREAKDDRTWCCVKKADRICPVYVGSKESVVSFHWEQYIPETLPTLT